MRLVGDGLLVGDGADRGNGVAASREDRLVQERMSLVSDLTGAPSSRLVSACQRGTLLGIDARTSHWATMEMR